ncbi:MAG: hypothetical protein P8Z79_23810, partial [Sedimentisphaerales bacterium]
MLIEKMSTTATNGLLSVVLVMSLALHVNARSYLESDAVDLLDASSGPHVRLVVRDGYLPGVPVLVRIEVLDDEGRIDRSLWDAVAFLSVADNPNVAPSTDQVTLYNGLGSALVRFAGGGDFTLRAKVNGMGADATLIDWSGRPIHSVSGRLARSQTWSGIYHVTGGDFTIPAGVVLTLDPGTLVLIDGAPSGAGGTDIDVAGTIRSLGTSTSPVTLTAYVPDENWGELHCVGADPSMFEYTNVTAAGRSPHVGHSNSGPAIRAVGSTLVFEHCSLTDHAGKIMDASSGCDLTFRDCLLARSVMGPEISGTALWFENSWITGMHADDDADGLYIHGQQAGQQCRLIHGVAADVDDDGIDTLGSAVTIQDFFIRDCRDKGVSIYDGQVNIRDCLFVENNKSPEDPTVATIATKTFEGSAVIVNIDRTTIVTSKSPGQLDVGLQSHNKYGVTSGTIVYNVTNSIIDATDPVDVQAPYIESNVHVNYSDVFGETWPGTGNLNTDPLFLSRVKHDYRLQAASPCIDAGDPEADPDADLSIADQGYPWLGTVPSGLAEGSLTEDTVWTTGVGPYRLSGELVIPFGVSLTIMPGVSVLFDPDARMVIRGRLLAEGSEDELIRFTRTAGTGGTWGGLQFVGSMEDNRITHAIVEYGQANNGMIGLQGSNLTLEYVTLDHTILERIIATDSSLVVRNCIFTDTYPPSQEPTDNRSEHIVGRGIAPGGWFIVEGNLFGLTPGHNDAIDFDGPSRPDPILQVMNNVFTGGGDDALDLGGDAHIEGNVFMNYVKDEYNSAVGESNVISAGGGNHYVMVRNVFQDVQHVAQVKDDAFLTFENNTVVGVSAAATYFDLDLPGRRPGRGAYLSGNIFWNSPLIFEGIADTTDVAMHRSIVAAQWHYLGEGNIDADPLFADPDSDFHLEAGSPAAGAGPWGLDMGAYVPSGAAIYGEPDKLTSRTDVTLFVGGPG